MDLFGHLLLDHHEQEGRGIESTIHSDLDYYNTKGLCQGIKDNRSRSLPWVWLEGAGMRTTPTITLSFHLVELWERGTMEAVDGFGSGHHL